MALQDNNRVKKYLQEDKMADDSILSTEKEKELEKDIEAELVDEKLRCPVAFKIAKKHGVAPRAVGDTANRLGIKIAGCQLGCFP
jgi:hypothetical protein